MPLLLCRDVSVRSHVNAMGDSHFNRNGIAIQSELREPNGENWEIGVANGKIPSRN